MRARGVMKSAVLALAVLGCGPGGLEADDETIARRAPAPVEPVAGLPPSASVVVRAEEVQAERVRVRVIFAESVEAKVARIERIFRTDDKRWEAEIDKRKLNLPELAADTVFVKVLKAGSLEADEVHAKEVKVDGH